MRRYAGRVAMCTIGLALCCGLALAQAPDVEGDNPPVQRAPRQPVVRGSFGPDALLAAEDAETVVANVEDGVELTITTDKPEAVTPLQERIERSVTWMRQSIDRVCQQQQNGPAFRGMPGIWGVIWGGEVDVTSAKIEKGMVVGLTSANEEVAKNLKENMPRWIQEATERRKQMQEATRRYRVMLEVQRLLAGGKVRVEYVQGPDGLTVRFVSDDPELAKKLKDLLPQYFEQLAKNTTPAVPPVRVIRTDDGRRVNIIMDRPEPPAEED